MIYLNIEHYRMQSQPPAGCVILWRIDHLQDQHQILKPIIRNPREVVLNNQNPNNFSRYSFQGNLFSQEYFFPNTAPIFGDLLSLIQTSLPEKGNSIMIESQPYLSIRALRTSRAAAIAGGIPVIYAIAPAF